MALAQRLNELAAANSQGLLNDDEYRLLRQSVFAQHAASTVPPVEASLVPIERKHTPPQPPRKSQPETPTPTPPSRTLNGLLRRVTARRPQAPAPAPKRIPFLPRILQKRTPDAPPPPAPVHPIAIAYPAPAASPSSSNFSVPPPPPPPHAVRDVFDDDNLASARAIRAAITAAEDEAARLADAFAALEATTLRRLRSQRARRLPAATPASVAVLLEGREWREHRLVPSPSAPALARARAPSDASVRTASTAASRPHPQQPPPQAPPASPLSARFRLPTLRRKASLSSLSSHTPSLAPSGSTLPSLAPRSSGGSSTHPAPLLARSLSALGLRSARSPSTDTLSTPTPTPMRTPPRTLSPPHTPKRIRTPTPTRAPGTPTRTPTSTRTPNTPTRTPNTPPTQARSPPRGAAARASEPADDPELADIRARRDALIARYTARVEFLRAKLRGAELHEKLLRK